MKLKDLQAGDRFCYVDNPRFVHTFHGHADE
jgi:hypothetical protein